jgi:hypothetical protein
MTNANASEGAEQAMADSSGLAHLRPTTPMEMIDRVFLVIGTRPKLFAALALMFALPPLLLQLFQAFIPPKSGDSPDSIVLFATVAASLLIQWANAAVIAAAFQTLLFPARPLAAKAALRGALDRLFYLILTRFLVVSALIVLGLLLPQQLLSGNGGEPGFISVAIAAWSVGAAVYFGFGWALVPMVVMIERKSFVKAMLRSMDLMRLKFRKAVVFGDSALRRLLLVLIVPAAIYLFGQILVQGISLLATGQILFMWSAKVIQSSPAHRLVYLFDAGVSFAVSFFALPWLYSGLVMLYAECRMRHEALDIQVRLLTRGETAPLMSDSEETLAPFS